MIADLNAYHAFVASLRQPAVTAYFDALKMLGNVFIIENAKDLGQIVRDANMYGGTLSPDEVYEFLQVRACVRLMRCDSMRCKMACSREQGPLTPMISIVAPHSTRRVAISKRSRRPSTRRCELNPRKANVV